jgi:hypothetical protein
MAHFLKTAFLAGLLCSGFVLSAQENPSSANTAATAPDAAAAAPSAETKFWTFSAGLDTYSAFNANRPPSGSNDLRNFDMSSGSVYLNAASLGVEFKSDYFGAHLDGGYGNMFKTIAATDSWKGPNQYIMQGYVTVTPWKQSGPTLDFGKFYTSLGAEVPDTLSNFNYSRSLIFTLGTPYYHFGLRGSMPVSKTLTVGAQLVDGCNDVTGKNKGRMAIVTSALTHERWGWNQAVMTGSESAPGFESAVPSYRNVVDEVLTMTPRSSLHAYVEGLYGREHRTGFSPDNWYGFATSLRWEASKKLGFSPRIEYFGDPSGFNSGTAQHLREFTATADYKLHPLVTARFEFRRDMSDRGVFESRNGMSRSQQTLLVGLIAAWKTAR